jgi:hypothetical protein
MFAHHHLTPSMDREKAGPMPFKAIDVPSTATAAGTAEGDFEAAEQQQRRPDFLQPGREPAGAFEYSTRERLQHCTWQAVDLFSMPSVVQACSAVHPAAHC